MMEEGALETFYLLLFTFYNIYISSGMTVGKIWLNSMR